MTAEEKNMKQDKRDIVFISWLIGVIFWAIGGLILVIASFTDLVSSPINQSQLVSYLMLTLALIFMGYGVRERRKNN